MLRFRCKAYAGLLFRQRGTRFIAQGTQPPKSPSPLSSLVLKTQTENVLNEFTERINRISDTAASVLREKSSASHEHLTASAYKVMGLYHQYKNTCTFKMPETPKMAQILHLVARMTVQISYHKHMSDSRQEQIKRQTQEISQHAKSVLRDCEAGVCELNTFAVTQLFSVFWTLKLQEEGIKLWTELCASPNTDFVALITKPKVRGSIMDLMTSIGAPLDEIQKVYNMGALQDVNLQHDMCRALIVYGKHEEAVEMFDSIVANFPARNADEYKARLHDTFIGDCADATLALKYYYSAINGDVSYSILPHPSGVARLMERVFLVNDKDLSVPFDIWKTFFQIQSNLWNERNNNIVVYTLLTQWHRRYPSYNDEAQEFLKSLLATYTQIVPRMGPFFINSLVTVVSEWGIPHITESFLSMYKSFDVPMDLATYRVVLNAHQHLSVSQDTIKDLWDQFLSLAPELSKYDYIALARACDHPDRVNFFVEKFYTITDREIRKKVINYIQRSGRVENIRLKLDTQF